jgi:ribulose-phosphate 3-epimerase
MTIIAPSILACNFLKLQEEIESFNNLENIWFHLDIMDGHYVPNLTFGACVIKDISKITKHALDAHLMVTNPLDYIDTFQKLNLKNFTFHWEAVTHHDSAISKLKENFNSVGISLNPATPICSIPDYILKEIDLLLVMSVNPGFGGQSFIESTIEKVQSLDEKRKVLGAKFKIQVDGGVTDKNAKLLKDAGADILVAGSFIFGSSSYADAVNKLR